MNIKEIEQAIKAKHEEIEKLKEELEQANSNEPWCPKMGDCFYMVYSDGDITKVCFGLGATETKLVSIGNVFQSLTEAESYVETLKVAKLLKDAATRAGRRDGKFVPISRNHFIAYNNLDKEMVREEYTYDEFPNTIYFPDAESLKQAISDIGEHRIIKALFGREV